VVGFVISIALVTVAALVTRFAGWVQPAVILAERPGTGFIYHPDGWSVVVAVMAAIAGVLSLTSGRLGGLSGVFISVTTVPASANIALGLAFWLPEEILGSAAQLGINLVAMMLAGWAPLWVQDKLGGRLPTNPFMRDMYQRRRTEMLRRP
jgi:hypothetical protein